MPAKFSMGDRVRAKATVFDGGEESRDRNGLLLSEKCAADKNGEWCYGTVSFVDSFLACRKLMVRWQEEGDEDSIFWKFVAVLLPQIDSRGRDDLFREPEEVLGAQCHMIRLEQTYHRGGSSWGIAGSPNALHVLWQTQQKK